MSAVRNPSAETVSSLMRQYGLQKATNHQRDAPLATASTNAAGNQSIDISKKEGDPLGSTPQPAAAAAEPKQEEESRFEADSEHASEDDEDDEDDEDGAVVEQEDEQQRKFSIQSGLWAQVEQPQEVKATSWVECGSGNSRTLETPQTQSSGQPPAIKRQESDRPPSHPTNPRTMMISMQPPIDTSGRRGGISLPQGYSTTGGLARSVSAAGGADDPKANRAKYAPSPPPLPLDRVGSAHRLNGECGYMYRTQLGYAFDDGDGNRQIEPTTSKGYKLSLAPGTPTYVAVQRVADDLEGDGERVYRTVLRMSFIHRLETLQLCKANPCAFTATFTASERQRAFFHHNLEERYKCMNDIGGSGPWGRHRPQDVAGSQLFAKSFDLDVLRPPLPFAPSAIGIGGLADRAGSDPGTATVRCFEGFERDLLAEQMHLHCVEGGPPPCNLTLLPYPVCLAPEPLGIEAVFQRLYRHITEYMKSSRSLLSEDPPPYFERVPACDPGLSVKETPNNRSAPMLAHSISTKRDFAAENLLHIQTILHFVPAGGSAYDPAVDPDMLPPSPTLPQVPENVQPASPAVWGAPKPNHEISMLDIVDKAPQQQLLLLPVGTPRAPTIARAPPPGLPPPPPLPPLPLPLPLPPPSTLLVPPPSTLLVPRLGLDPVGYEGVNKRPLQKYAPIFAGGVKLR